MKRRLAIGLAVIVAVPLVTGLVVHDRGWETEEVIGAMALALTLSGALAALVEREVTRRRAEREAVFAAPGLTAEQRERWRAWLGVEVSRLRVGESGQLAKMVREGDPIDQSTTSVAQDGGRPRVRRSGPAAAVV